MREVRTETHELRDSFAMVAVLFISQARGVPLFDSDGTIYHPDQIAQEAYGLADAMLRARTK